MCLCVSVCAGKPLRQLIRCSVRKYLNFTRLIQTTLFYCFEYQLIKCTTENTIKLSCECLVFQQIRGQNELFGGIHAWWHFHRQHHCLRHSASHFFRLFFCVARSHCPTDHCVNGPSPQSNITNVFISVQQQNLMKSH